MVLGMGHRGDYGELGHDELWGVHWVLWEEWAGVRLEGV